MQRIRKKLVIRIWLAGIMVAAVVLINGNSWVRKGSARIMEAAQQSLLAGSLKAFYPAMAYPQGEAQPALFERYIQSLNGQVMPLVAYVESAVADQYATQLENEIPVQELADCTQVEEDAEAAESETQRAERVLAQFAGEQSTVQAESERVLGENLQSAPVSGQEYAVETLSYDFLINHFYTVDSTTDITAEQLNAQELLGRDMTMQGDNSSPQILIYHTHSQEEFIDSVEGDSSTTIVGVGDYLARLLNERYGYNVIHNRTVYDIVDGKLDRNRAYSMALLDLKQILEENPSIEVVIDLHRDGVDGQKMVSEINGKPTAKLMFFNGLSYTKKNGANENLKNPYITDNLAFSLQLQMEAAKYYPGATRKIYLKGYRYNMHLRAKSLLVESGTQNNTVQEEMNAMEVLADVLHRVLSGNSQ